MNNPNFLPNSKFDFQACSYLEKASNKEITPYLGELLEWLQDINWPIAGKIISRLSSFDERIIPYISKILESNDSIWKYWVITNLLPKLKDNVQMLCIPIVRKLANNPTQNDLNEEVDQVAKEYLESNEHVL